MRRSEYFRLLDLADDLMSRFGGSYCYDAEEAAREDGKESAYESSADEIRWFLDEVVVDVEDVTTCPSTSVLPAGARHRMHELGAKPYQVFLGKELGCKTCAAHVVGDGSD